MPRSIRIDFRGAVHHVVNRGQNGRDIFLRPDDRELFLQALDLACLRYGSTLHTWAFMPNHFHAVITSGEARISAAIRDAKSRYTQKINSRHGWDGSLFAGRFFNRVVLDPRYLQAVLLYVTMNPERSTLGRRDAWTGRHRLAADDPLMIEAFGSFSIYEQHEAVALEHQDLLHLPLLPSTPRGPTTGVVGSSDRRFHRVRSGLNQLARLLNCTPGDLIKPSPGRANERATLMTWYLVTCGDLTHAEIGGVLGLSPRAVGARAARIDTEILNGSAIGGTALGLLPGQPNLRDCRPTVERTPLMNAATHA